MILDNEDQKKNLLGVIGAFPINTNLAQALPVVETLYQLRTAVEQAEIKTEKKEGEETK